MSRQPPAPIRPKLWKKPPSLFLLGALSLWLFASGERRIAGQSGDEKLATVLQDLAQTGLPGGGDLTLRPKSVQDAVASRRVRFDGSGNVQVYVLMSAVSEVRMRTAPVCASTRIRNISPRFRLINVPPGF